MNEDHAVLCSSAEWADHLRTDVLTPMLDGLDLGAQMIEVGPGPGAATEWLRQRVGRLVAVDADAHAIAALAERYAGTNVEAIATDATDLPFADGTFDSAATFTMLHHVPTVEGQQRLLEELVRVLRPGGFLVGADSLASDELREFHRGDTYNPVDPSRLLRWLQRLGCRPITITVDWHLSFLAQTAAAQA
jgi:ubiquinone/menaquinone biosynthesis C-methylase UbiE